MLSLGLLLFVVLAAITARSTLDAWRSTVERSRGEALFDLVQVATPTRPTNTPGAVAWLDLEVKRYGEKLAEEQRAAYRELVSVGGGATAGQVPGFLRPLSDALIEVAATPAPPGALRLLSHAEATARGLEAGNGAETGTDSSSFRVQRFLDATGDDGEVRTLVLTRRRALDTPFDPNEPGNDEPSNRFLRRAVPYLAAVAEKLEAEPLEVSIAGRPLRVLRVYALGEDGTFVSLPEPGTPAAKRLGTLREEGREFRKQPQRPSYVSNEFFFQFDFSRPSTRYSGLYLDLAGYGLVTTLTASVSGPDGEPWAVGAIDIAFDIDWRDFAHRIASPRKAFLVELDHAPAPTGWQPWSTLDQALGGEDPTAGGVQPPETPDQEIRDIVTTLADREASSGYRAEAGSLYHAVVEGRGAIAFFQVARLRWLVVHFPELPARFPWLAATLLGVLAMALVAGVEHNRRRAQSEQSKAEAESREKENLLESMKVPLTVVDPNSDEVVFGNAAALALGLEPGRRIGDMVAGEGASEHYHRMQRAGPETRRAYGVPMALRATDGGDEVRHAVVRSVAVTAPIETLNADQRHRLGIFFPIEPEADLAIFAHELETNTRGDERRRLAGLLAHGVDTLARVLAHRLDRKTEADDFTRWLVRYLERRLAVTGWLLEHWHAEPPLPPEITCEASHVRATLERLGRIFGVVRDDAELRSRLHWDNGVLSESADPKCSNQPFELGFDWPDEHLFTSPVRGGVGLFFEEALVNALRHGRPGSCPRVDLCFDPVRRELRCEVENPVAPAPRRPSDDVEPYGGRRLLERLAHLFGWHDLAFEQDGETFRLRWAIPVGERVAPGEVD